MQRRAMNRLMGLQFKVAYKKGKENAAADALSIAGHLLALQAVSSSQPVWVQELVNSNTTDPRAQQLLAQLAVHTPNEQGYILDKGLIKFKDKIWVAQNSAMQTKLIDAFHSSAIGGHSGVQATYQRIHRLFHWKGLKLAVEDFVKQCQICQQAKHMNTHPTGLLQPLRIPEGAWQDISMDFIEGLPSSEGYEVILVVVDRFTKYTHFIPIKHPFTAHTIARAVFDNVVKLHGLPKTIISDRDKIFTSAFWKDLFAMLGTHLVFSSAYHPQTDGRTERESTNA